jgi:hypothetical protein
MPTKKSTTKSPATKSAATKKSVLPNLALPSALAIDPAIATAAARSVVIIPRPGPLAAAASNQVIGMAAAMTDLASHNLPLKTLLQQKKAALEAFMAQAMFSACGIAASATGMAGAAAKPGQLASVRLLEGLGAVVVDRSLVVCLPGKPRGAVECLGFVAGAIPHCVEVIQEIPTSC